MWKQLSCILACAAGTALPAQAETTWQFTYTGLHSVETDTFIADYTIYGAFIGTDSDGDGILQQSELTRFVFDFIDYDPDGEETYCDPGSYCQLTGFSYALNGELNFTAHWRYSDEGAFSSRTTYAGDRVYFEGYTNANPAGVSYTYRWTDQTRFVITPAPVPEPSAPLLLTAGLAVLGLRRLRERHSPRP